MKSADTAKYTVNFHSQVSRPGLWGWEKCLNLIPPVPGQDRGNRFRKGAAPAKRAMRGFADIVQAMREIAGDRIIVSMTVLAGSASFFIGNAYNAQLPGFAENLGHGDPGLAYSMLLAADAAGGLLAGVVLESMALLRPAPRMAIVLALLWCCALVGFAVADIYAVALALLFAAGFLELTFNAMAQTLVQLNAHQEIRGRTLGLFNMASLGLRAFSGITVGLIGSITGVHWSLALSALVLAAITCLLLSKARDPGVTS